MTETVNCDCKLKNMYLEIVSPEATLFSGEVTSVAVPGVNGEFEMLKITLLLYLY